MLRRAALATLLIGSNTLTGCSAHHARTAGGTIGAVGGVTAIVGLGIATGCEPFTGDDDDETTCATDAWEPDPENGLRVGGVGLFLLAVGALLYVAGSDATNWSSSASATPDATATPPPEPAEPPDDPPAPTLESNW